MIFYLFIKCHCKNWEEQNVMEKVVWNNFEDTYVTRCVFSDLTSPGPEITDYGAAWFTEEWITNEFHDSIFIRCNTPNGRAGAIWVNNKNTVSVGNCFINCSAGNNFDKQVFYSFGTVVQTFNLTSVTHCGSQSQVGTSTIAMIDFRSAFVCAFNTSFNYVSGKTGGIAVGSGDANFLKYISIINNTDGDGCTFNLCGSDQNRDYTISFCNLVSNTFGQFGLLTAVNCVNAMIDHVVFLGNIGDAVANITSDYPSKMSFTSCYFDCDESHIHNSTTTDCYFNVQATTFDISTANGQNCFMTLYPETPTSNQPTGTLTETKSSANNHKTRDTIIIASVCGAVLLVIGVVAIIVFIKKNEPGNVNVLNSDLISSNTN